MRIGHIERQAFHQHPQPGFGRAVSRNVRVRRVPGPTAGKHHAPRLLVMQEPEYSRLGQMESAIQINTNLAIPLFRCDCTNIGQIHNRSVRNNQRRNT